MDFLRSNARCRSPSSQEGSRSSYGYGHQRALPLAEAERPFPRLSQPPILPPPRVIRGLSFLGRPGSGPQGGAVRRWLRPLWQAQPESAVPALLPPAAERGNCGWPQAAGVNPGTAAA